MLWVQLVEYLEVRPFLPSQTRVERVRTRRKGTLPRKGESRSNSYLIFGA